MSTEILVSGGEVSHAWILDSGASLHVMPHREWFSRYEETVGTITLGKTFACDIIGIGDIPMVLSNGMRFVVENVCHVPCLTRNLISIPQLDDLGYKVTFSQSSWKISKGNILVAHGIKVGSLYPLYVSSKDIVLTVTGSHQFLCGIAGWDTCLEKLWRLFLIRVACLSYAFQTSVFVSIACTGNRHASQEMFLLRKKGGR